VNIMKANDQPGPSVFIILGGAGDRKAETKYGPRHGGWYDCFTESAKRVLTKTYHHPTLTKL
jgi:hypothetical protein